MRRAAIVLLLLTPAALAQVLVTAGELPRIERIFQSRDGVDALPCEVVPLTPSLNFAFRYQAGYSFRVPQSQYRDSTRGWSVLTSISPEGGAAVHLLARTRLSEATRVGASFSIRGLYFLGEGRYSVESTIRDDRNRVCRKQWQVVVEPSRLDRAVPPALRPNTVRPFSPFIAPEVPSQGDGAPKRLSVLLNAAAFSTGRTTMRPHDRAVLLGALTSLLEHLPAASMRLVVFSLEQQREIFRADNFAPPDTEKVAAAVRSFEQATVDVHVLEKPLGHVDFLAGLIGRERDAPDPADTVVFLGPTSRYGNKIPENALPAPVGGTAHFFYVRYESPRHAPSTPEIPDDAAAQSASAPRLPSSGTGVGGRGRARPSDPPVPSQVPVAQPDIIMAAVARLKGKTLTIHTPADLAKAIRKIAEARP